MCIFSCNVVMPVQSLKSSEPTFRSFGMFVKPVHPLKFKDLLTFRPFGMLVKPVHPLKSSEPTFRPFGKLVKPIQSSKQRLPATLRF